MSEGIQTKIKSARGDNWVKGLDSLRFVLALIVFLSHLSNEPSNYLKSLDGKLWHWMGIALNHVFLGPGAVVAFFIISGFVIHYPFKGKSLNTKQFLVRRWVRIGIPLLIVVAIALYRGGIGLVPIWSLYCELIYYTLYPLLRRLPLSWTQQFWFAFAIAAVVIVVGSYHTEIASMITQSDQGYTGSYAALGDGFTWLVGLPCWLIGVLIADVVDSRTIVVSQVRINIIRLCALVVAMLVVGLKAHVYVSYLLTLNFFAFMLGYWILNEILFFRTHAASAILEYAGKFSYSLYLLHVLLVQWFYSQFGMSLALYPVAIAFTLVSSWLFYRFVEKPSHELSKYWARKL